MPVTSAVSVSWTQFTLDVCEAESSMPASQQAGIAVIRVGSCTNILARVMASYEVQCPSAHHFTVYTPTLIFRYLLYWRVFAFYLWIFIAFTYVSKPSFIKFAHTQQIPKHDWCLWQALLPPELEAWFLVSCLSLCLHSSLHGADGMFIVLGMFHTSLSLTALWWCMMHKVWECTGVCVRLRKSSPVRCLLQ